MDYIQNSYINALLADATCATLWGSKNNRWLPFEDQRKSLIASLTEAQTDYLVGPAKPLQPA